MASTSLRKAFRYPDDSDEDNEHVREEFDEEEQDRMIDQLRMIDDRRNSYYSIRFAAIPLLSGFIYIPPMLSGFSSLHEQCLSFISVISLLATAYIMKHLPLQHPDPMGKISDNRARVKSCLVIVNAIVCTLLTLIYAFYPMAETRLKVQSFRYLIPGAMFVAILIARKVMLSVDLKELENLRYMYKGA
ncbi:hypothetical protein BO70DRAFT_347492 [Aspergillus heteromorphus CBS 117.55]|uniref:Uncharacterized protein n=1 Tax=Aspergillus heteromorphus CBS 117.55 TaxID=1448321 RepID=A0A317UPS5_9EURO|nr:uncharacterized protein BO70DRAFT_347492 [Aspergillus heteromorphus CBS 117.55]PWY63545.1 hypothetical protein BO70DRAFT_347492 [Aspergillus heteromorphus CBS 117.55]